MCTHAPTSGGRVIGVDGVSDFNALHSGKHNEKVQLCAFDVLALDGDDYLDALPRAPYRTDRVGRTRSAANGEGALLPKLLIFFRYGQADAGRAWRRTSGSKGWRRACDSAIMPGLHGDERRPSNAVQKFAQQCIQIVGFRLEVIWQTLQ